MNNDSDSFSSGRNELASGTAAAPSHHHLTTTALEVDTSLDGDQVPSGNNSDSVVFSTPPRSDCKENVYRNFDDDVVNYIQSDDDLNIFQPFLNEVDDEDDSCDDVDLSRTEYLHAHDISETLPDRNYEDMEAEDEHHHFHHHHHHHHHNSSTFSVNLSSTTGSTAGATTVARGNLHSSRDFHLNHFDDTSTSYNTDEGYADDESERKIRAILGSGVNMEPSHGAQQPLPPQSADTLLLPSSTSNQQNSQQLPPSPSNRFSTLSRSASASPSMNQNNNPSTTAQQPTSASFFRYFRSWGKSQQESTVSTAAERAEIGGDRAAVELTTSDDEEDDFSMSQEETSWMDDDDDMSDSSDDELKEDNRLKYNIDWNCLPVLPNRFCLPHHPPMASSYPDDSRKVSAPPPYLDASLFRNAHKDLTSTEATEFALDHGTLLQAVLQLLAERDQVGVEGSMDATDNIWKKGSLKKLSFSVGRRKNQRPAVAGAWKVKYAELRQGNLCYYEDSGKTGRKTIHLRQADTIVQESTYRGPGFVFELLVQGSPTRYWMASSEEERQAWIKAIQTATIGDDAPRKELDLQPYEKSLEVYNALRESLQQTETQELYLESIQVAMKELASLQVPVQWVQEQIENDLSPILLGKLKPPKFGRSPQKLLKSSITEFWKNMNQITFSINGIIVPRNTQLASERIVGALTRCILEYDKEYCASEEREIDGLESTFISELQAISYARHILLTVLRSKERQDTAFVVRYLLENPNVVISEQNPRDENDLNPVNIEVSFAGEDLPDEFLHSEEIASWVWTRTRRKNPSSIAATVTATGRKQRYTYAVLSGTVLSYYAAASPRPHGLRGQLVLCSTTIVRYDGEEIVPENDNSNTGVRHVLCIVSENHQDRLISFDNYSDLVTWKDAIQLAIDTAGPGVQNPPRIVTTTTSTPTNMSLMVPAKMLKGAERAIKVAADGTIQGGIRVIKGAKNGGVRVIRGAKDGGIRVIRTATGSGFKVIRGAVGMLQRQNKSDTTNDAGPIQRRPSFQMLFNNTIVQHGKREPTVQCVFQTTQTFVIRDRNYSERGDDSMGDYLDTSAGSTTTTTTDRYGNDSSHNNNTTSNYHPHGGWIKVQAKLYQAFLMSGGPTSGRIARGDALIELIFVETKVHHDDDASG